MPPEIKYNKIVDVIRQFLTKSVSDSSLDGYVVGLSGGIDSALAAKLAVTALGSAKVFGLMMPYRSSSENSVTDALTLATQLGIEYQTIDISPMIDAYYQEIDQTLRIRAGNKMARERMSILFDISHKMNRLVLGTGNRTEICLGYTTLFGDSACSVNPIGGLYKTEVQALAEFLDLPQAIRDKAPSADLWKDQTDEKEIGVTYEEIDQLLIRLVDEGERSLQVLYGEGFKNENINRIISLLNRNSFKRQLPPVESLNRSPIPDFIKLSD